VQGVSRDAKQDRPGPECETGRLGPVRARRIGDQARPSPTRPQNWAAQPGLGPPNGDSGMGRRPDQADPGQTGPGFKKPLKI